MSQVPLEAFRGHIEECLRDLNTRLLKVYPKGSKGAMDARQPIAEFCGVKADTVTRWLYEPGKALPVGVPRIKLMCYLSLLGYEVIEFDHIPRKQKQFAELIGFDVLTIDEATSLLGYAKPQTLLQVLQGRGGVLEDREQKMWDIWVSHKDELHRKQGEARRKYVLELTRPEGEVRPEPMREAKPTTRDLFATVKVMEALLVLLEEASTEGLPIIEINALQPEQVQTVLHLNARLNVISSQLLTANRPREAKR